MAESRCDRCGAPYRARKDQPIRYPPIFLLLVLGDPPLPCGHRLLELFFAVIEDHLGSEMPISSTVRAPLVTHTVGSGFNGLASVLS